MTAFNGFSCPSSITACCAMQNDFDFYACHEELKLLKACCKQYRGASPDVQSVTNDAMPRTELSLFSAVIVHLRSQTSASTAASRPTAQRLMRRLHIRLGRRGARRTDAG